MIVARRIGSRGGADVKEERIDRPAKDADRAAPSSFLAKRRSNSLLSAAQRAKLAQAGGGGEVPPGKHAWIRGAFRQEPSRPAANGLLSSLAFHGMFGVAVAAGAFNSLAVTEAFERAAPLSAVVVELPKIEPPPPIAVPASAGGAPAAPLGEKPGPVPKGLKSRKGNDRANDARQAGVLGMLAGLEGRGNRSSKQRGSTVGPDQGSPAPFAGLAGLKDYEGGYLPVGGAGGTGGGGVGTDEGTGAGGGRGSGQAKGLLNSYGDGTGDQVILERRGSARGAVGGIGTGEGGGGCRDESAIARIVEANKGAVRRCYNSALKRDKDLLGEISVRFVIAESGAVRTAEIIGRSLSDRELEACVLQTLKSLSFGAKPGCETIVRYTFNLTRSM
jgi:hypothetical protein